MQPHQTSRRGFGAIGLSLLAHALVGLVLWLRPEPKPAPPPAAALKWVDVESIPTPKVVEPQALSPERVLPQPPAATPQKKKKSATPTTPMAPGGSASSAPGTDAPVAERGTGPALGPPTKKPSLTPGLGFVMTMPEAADAEDTRGTTSRNDPMDQPDAVAVREYEAEKVGRKLSLDLATDVARAQQGAGRVPGFFTSISRSLQDAAEKADVQVSKESQGAQVRNAIGSVLDPTRTKPSEAAVNRVAETAFVQNSRMGNPALPGDQQQFNQAVAQGFTRFESIKENLAATQLRTVVALTTDPRGVLAEASIIERSGDSTFDESALHLSRKVVRAMPDSDEKALGTSWWRSRWVFTWEPPRMKVRMLDATPLAPPMQ